MKRPVKPLCLYVIFLLFVNISKGQAQPANLLTNPGFEGNYRIVADGQQVADGWQPWYLAPGPNSPSYENAQPTFAPTAPDATRIRSGENAQRYFTDLYYTHVGGVYQRVTNITPGTELRFSVYAYVWSSNLDDVNVSEEPGGVLVEVGIDPTGGTDPESTAIIWGVSDEQYDAYRQYSVIATATGNAVTVFVRSSVDFPQRNNYIYLDDAVLEITTDSPVQPSATATPQPTNTPIPQPTHTPLPQPTNTSQPTSVAFDPTPTQEGVVPTSTTLPFLPTPTTQPSATTVVTVSPASTATPGAVGGPINDQFPSTVMHTVRRGDTVSRLAVLYGSTVEAIIQANGLNSDGLIFVGQGLLIPVPISAVATNTPLPTPVVIIVTATPGFGTGGGQVVYIVQPGDTLTQIARRFNMTVTAIAQANGIVNVNQIQAGQQLIIPGTGGPLDPQVVPTSPVVQATPIPTQPPNPATYVVQPGDNLYRISLRFNVTMAALAQANGILNVNRLFAGQVLNIP